MPSGEPTLNELAAQIAEELMAANHFVTLGERQKEIYRYDKQAGIYVADGYSYIARKVEENFSDRALASTHLVNEVIGHIERSTAESRDIFTQNGDTPRLVLENCALNLNTMQVEDFSPGLYALSKIHVKYDPKADCPVFKKFLNEILSPDDVMGVQEDLGAILRQKYLTKKFSIYLGEPDTGKTTLISVFTTFLGADNVSSVGIQELASHDKFQLAGLFGKMANIRDDLAKDVIHSTGKLKEITGGFQIQAEMKFKDPFTFMNYAFLIFTCNTLPEVEEDDSAFFDRVVIRLFKNRFGGHETPDRELLTKLTTTEELSGILNWAIEGLKRLRDNGWNFTTTSSLEITREDYKRRSDPVWAFVQDCLIEESAGVVVKETLYNAFKNYCQERGIPLIQKGSFYSTLPSKVTITSGYREVIEGQGKKHCFAGISLKCSLNGERPAPPAPPAPEQGRSDQPDQPDRGFYHLRDTGQDYPKASEPSQGDTDQGSFPASTERSFKCGRCDFETSNKLEFLEHVKQHEASEA